MPPRKHSPDRGPTAPLRRFLLAVSPDEGEPELVADDGAHAVRVLRLAAGDRLIGLDGRGGAWPLVVAGTLGRRLTLEPDGEPRREPGPGMPGAPLPWIEVLVAWPKAGRPEAMLERLTQLGAARISPWTTNRSGQEARAGDGSAPRRRRLLRVLAEACKQSGRLWLPELGETVEGVAGIEQREDAASAVLDPTATCGLGSWARDTAGRGVERIVLAIGPEGGLAPDELAALAARGFEPARIGPHVLRIETAAEAAVAIVAQAATETWPDPAS